MGILCCLRVRGTGGAAPNFIPPRRAMRSAMVRRRVVSSSSAGVSSDTGWFVDGGAAVGTVGAGAGTGTGGMLIEVITEELSGACTMIDARLMFVGEVGLCNSGSIGSFENNHSYLVRQSERRTYRLQYPLLPVHHHPRGGHMDYSSHVHREGRDVVSQKYS